MTMGSKMYCNLMYTLPHQQKQYTFSTLELSIPKEFLIPRLIQTTCAITMMHLYYNVPSDDGDSIGDFSSDEEYRGTTTSPLPPPAHQAVVY